MLFYNSLIIGSSTFLIISVFVQNPLLVSSEQFVKLNIKINYYSNQTEKFFLVGDLNLYDVNELHNYIISYLSNWWKKNHLIDNNIIHQVTCSINSHNYSDLIDIKDKIENLSQFKSIKTIEISYNNNVEKIEFYGDYSIFAESLLLNKIEIITNDKCSIRSMK